MRIEVLFSQPWPPNGSAPGGASGLPFTWECASAFRMVTIGEWANGHPGARGGQASYLPSLLASLNG